METQLTVNYTGGWQHAGLIVWEGDDNFFRSTITHSLSGGNIYVEQSKDNPGANPEGTRSQAGGNATISPTKQPITIRMRYIRSAGSNTVAAHYRVMAPANLASPDWIAFGGAGDFLNLNPTGDRRDGPGSRIGIIAAGNFPGTTGNHPYQGTPGTVKVDYFRVTPDTVESCPDDDVEPPATTAALDPAEPGSGPVDVNFSATDGTDANASGVAATEYRVDGGEWQVAENGGSADPFTSSVTVSAAGAHTVAYRSRDEEGNLEVADEIEFTIEEGGGGDEDTTPPVTAHALDPSSPGAGGTYSGPGRRDAVGHRSRRGLRARRAGRRTTSTPPAPSGRPATSTRSRATSSAGTSRSPTRSSRTTCGSSRRAATPIRPAATCTR